MNEHDKILRPINLKDYRGILNRKKHMVFIERR